MKLTILATSVMFAVGGGPALAQSGPDLKPGKWEIHGSGSGGGGEFKRTLCVPSRSDTPSPPRLMILPLSPTKCTPSKTAKHGAVETSVMTCDSADGVHNVTQVTVTHFGPTDFSTRRQVHQEGGPNGVRNTDNTTMMHWLGPC